MSKRKKKGVSTKVFLSLLALVLVVGCAVGGTIAWLTATTEPVVNTFTYGKINIMLTETTGNAYKIIPGVNISKDPKVTVIGGSEACWLFVKVAEEGTFVAGRVTYSIAEGWTKGDGTDIPENVYYRSVSASDGNQDIYVLAGDTTYPYGVVTVSENLTKAEVNRVATQQPTLTFTAYAVQKDGISTAADAWDKVKNN